MSPNKEHDSRVRYAWPRNSCDLPLGAAQQNVAIALGNDGFRELGARPI